MKFKKIFLLIVVVVSVAQVSFAAPAKDLVLVLDTSLSMVGRGGKDIMPQVKNSIDNFIDQLNKKDSFTFITFDEKVHVYPTEYILHKSNKSILKDYIAMVEARGRWTYTLGMLKAATDVASDLALENSRREKVIVVLTDGLDDPPPVNLRKKLNIKDIAVKDKKKTFIYFIDLSDSQNNSVKTEKFNKLTKNIETNVTKNVYVIDNKNGIEKTIEDVLPAQIEKDSNAGVSIWLICLFIVLGIALIGAFLFFFLRKKDIVHGVLQYWEDSLFDPAIEEIDLSILNLSKVRIGSSYTADFKINKLQAKNPIPLVLQAEKIKGQGSIVKVISEEATFQHQKDNGSSYLNDGDTFKIGNYSFKYLVQ